MVELEVVTVSILLAAVGLLLYVSRYSIRMINRSAKTTVISTYLQKLGIKKVDHSFFNELNDQGVKNLLTILANVKQWESQLDFGGGSLGKVMQQIQAMQQMQQMSQQPQEAQANIAK